MTLCQKNIYFVDSYHGIHVASDVEIDSQADVKQDAGSKSDISDLTRQCPQEGRNIALGIIDDHYNKTDVNLFHVAALTVLPDSEEVEVEEEVEEGTEEMVQDVVEDVMTEEIITVIEFTDSKIEFVKEQERVSYIPIGDLENPLWVPLQQEHQQQLPETSSIYEVYGESAMQPHLSDHVYTSCTDCKNGRCQQHKERTISKPRVKGTQYKCSQCDYVSTRRQTLKQHLATHLINKPFKCRFCDYSASQKQGLVAHLLKFHYQQKPFKCSQCDYSAFRKQHLVAHMGKHLEDKPFKCTQCTFQTAWKEYLSVHIKRIHSNPQTKASDEDVTFKPWRE